jgi:hypothetical protein
MKKPGFKNGLTNNRRPHRGSSRSYKGKNIQDMNLSERLVFESRQLQAYFDRLDKKTK